MVSLYRDGDRAPALSGRFAARMGELRQPDRNLRRLVIDDVTLQIGCGQNGTLQLADRIGGSPPWFGGGAGVREIRVHEESGAFRLIYLASRPEGVYVLHCFQKKTQKTSRPRGKAIRGAEACLPKALRTHKSENNVR